jgi:hypothetical protein
MIMDFDAQTVTTIHKTQKTWSVMKFSDLGQVVKQADIDARIDVKETGQKKIINGFNATEVVMTMEMDSPQMSQAGMKMQMEIDTWRSSEVPGAQELKAFHHVIRTIRWPIWPGYGSTTARPADGSKPSKPG